MNNAAHEGFEEQSIESLYQNSNIFEPFFNNLIHMQEAVEAQTTMNQIDDTQNNLLG